MDFFISTNNQILGPGYQEVESPGLTADFDRPVRDSLLYVSAMPQTLLYHSSVNDSENWLWYLHDENKITR